MFNYRAAEGLSVWSRTGQGWRGRPGPRPPARKESSEPAMIREIMRLAHRIDAWLRDHVGRPYTVILAIGLVYGIVASVRTLIHDAETRLDVFKLVVAVLFQIALLINQLAQFHEYREERAARRARRRKG